MNVSLAEFEAQFINYIGTPVQVTIAGAAEGLGTVSAGILMSITVTRTSGSTYCAIYFQGRDVLSLELSDTDVLLHSVAQVSFRTKS